MHINASFLKSIDQTLFFECGVQFKLNVYMGWYGKSVWCLEMEGKHHLNINSFALILTVKKDFPWC